jgi:alpha-maltose-1-phosphate synthase
VEDGETGLLVPPGDPGALADALRHLLADPARARAMGARGRARVESRFLWGHVAERLEEALLAALSPHGKAA